MAHPSITRLKIDLFISTATGTAFDLDRPAIALGADNTHPRYCGLDR